MHTLNEIKLNNKNNTKRLTLTQNFILMLRRKNLQKDEKRRFEKCYAFEMFITKEQSLRIVYVRKHRQTYKLVGLSGVFSHKNR